MPFTQKQVTYFFLAGTVIILGHRSIMTPQKHKRKLTQRNRPLSTGHEEAALDPPE